jgi:hypothetical protein
MDWGCTIHIDKTKLPTLIKIEEAMTEEDEEESKKKNEVIRSEIAD